MGSDYESTVRRAERASGRALTDHEVILFLAEEVEQMREKVKLSEMEQRIFDLGELFGRLKMIEELMNDKDKK